MLRLVLLACISLLSGCSCDALWGRYEVPCTRGFDCPLDAAMPGGGDGDMATGGGGDMATSVGDGGVGDGGIVDGGMGDMTLPPIGEMGMINDMIVPDPKDMITRVELGVIELGVIDVLR
jgi:hypothetical protein